MKYLAASLGAIGLGVFLIFKAVSSWNSGVLTGTGKVSHSVTTYADEPILFMILTGFLGSFGTFLIGLVLIKAARDDRRSRK